MKSWLNGKQIDETEATISIFDRSYLYGEGVFETLRCYQGRPAFLARHLRRLQKNCQKLEIPFDYSEEELLTAVDQLLQANQLQEAVCRMTLSTVGATFSVDRPKNPKINLSIFCRPVTLDAKLFDTGVKVLALTSFVNDSPATANIKSTSYLTKMLARAEASKAGVYETLLRNNCGFWVEGNRTNFFIVSGGVVLTAPISDGLLSGITREVILEILQEEKIPHREDHITDNMLKEAEEIFLTGSTSEVMPVCEVAGIWQRPVRSNSFAKKLRQFYLSRCQ